MLRVTCCVLYEGLALDHHFATCHPQSATCHLLPALTNRAIITQAFGISSEVIFFDHEALATIGASSYLSSDRDGDERTIELIWRGGPLIPDALYYLRPVNRSNTMIYYCLATEDEYRWSCPKN